MRKKNDIVNLLFAAAVLLAGCNESLEDTYSDYAGDGKIRYVAKCSGISTTPGWERLMVNWVNGKDATIDKIKVIWSCEGRKDSVLLPNTSTTYELKDLPDGSYRFDVCAVDQFGNESLREITNGRPYTREHEIMRSFTRGVTKSWFLSNKMIFFSDSWNENIVEMKLQYKNTQGETKYYEFEKESSYNAFVTIDDVSMNPADTVYVLRRGKLKDSPDEVLFDPYVISRKKNFSAGFIHAIEGRYGYPTETPEQEAAFLDFVEHAEELELDYTIETLEDVLYCSNLKRLVVGKNRYLQKFVNRWYNVYDNSKILKDPQKSYLVVEKASDPEVLGLKVHYYGHQTSCIHYFDKVYSWMVYEGYPTLPGDLGLITADDLKADEEGNKVRCTPDDPYDELNNLLDDDANTRWETIPLQNMRTYDMHMELLEATEIRGIKVSQIKYSSGEKQAPFFMPTMINIQTSVDGAVWKDMTWFETNELGQGPGEVTLLPVVEGSRLVRYIRFTLHDRADQGNNWAIKLGDILPYR